ncbi:hypothetical protein HC031_27045 [Planosporangium thailandense]|uniref:Uncharacterized protein n=1 Tax=Planosporangium thailandense TaxID=765197 RepID=A0ABX0Y4L3_9ACTN|nr:hypothetical protein [Planosporangium thailandense]NJC73350.1 hypothetical protein [Planosporangium thailandense]
MRTAPVDITAAPRAVISATAGLLYKVGRSVLGESRVPTAQANAWEAVCADRQRAQSRAELERWLASDRQRRTTPVR